MLVPTVTPAKVEHLFSVAVCPRKGGFSLTAGTNFPDPASEVVLNVFSGKLVEIILRPRLCPGPLCWSLHFPDPLIGKAYVLCAHSCANAPSLQDETHEVFHLIGADGALVQDVLCA